MIKTTIIPHVNTTSYWNSYSSQNTIRVTVLIAIEKFVPFCRTISSIGWIQRETIYLLSYVTVFEKNSDLSYSSVIKKENKSGYYTRRRDAMTMRKYETSGQILLSLWSSSPHRCNLHRSPTTTTTTSKTTTTTTTSIDADIHWRKMGANQSTRSAPTPGEEGKRSIVSLQGEKERKKKYNSILSQTQISYIYIYVQ